MKNKILFLTDINKKIGTGHFMRSARMAKEFIKFKYKIYLISKTKKKNDKTKLFKKIYHLPSYDKIFNLILKINPHLLIIDLPKPDLKFEKKLSMKNINFLIYDRLLRKKIHSNFLINLNPKITKKDYDKKLIKNTRLLLGPKYFPINSNIYQKKILDRIKNVLIFLGGGKNNYNLINQILSVIAKSKIKDCNIYFISMEKIDFHKKKNYRNNYNLKLNFINNTDDIYSFVRKSDLSIITSGSISFESCFFNVPMILISIAENQISIAKSWNKLKLGCYAGNPQNKNFNTKLNNYINNLYNFDERFKMSNKQKKIYNNTFSYIPDLVSVRKNEF